MSSLHATLRVTLTVSLTGCRTAAPTATSQNEAVAKCRSQLDGISALPPLDRPSAFGAAGACVLEAGCAEGTATVPEASAADVSEPMSARALQQVFCDCRKTIASLPDVAPQLRQARLAAGCSAKLFRRCASAWRDLGPPATHGEQLVQHCKEAYCATLSGDVALCRGDGSGDAQWADFLSAAAETESTDRVAAATLGYLLGLSHSVFEVRIPAVAAPKLGEPAKKTAFKRPLNLTVIITANKLAVTSHEPGTRTIISHTGRGGSDWPAAAHRADEPPPDRVTVRLTDDALSLAVTAGAFKRLIPLDKGRVAAVHMQDGSETSLVVQPLLTALTDWASAAGTPEGAPVIAMQIGEDVPYLTVAKVVHTSAMAGFDQLNFALLERLSSSVTTEPMPDLRRLYNAVSAIKARHPDETSIYLAAETTVPWRMVSAVISVVRHQLPSADYREDAAWTAAFDGLDRDQARALFPRVVFVVAE